MGKYRRQPPSFQQLPGIAQSTHGLKVQIGIGAPCKAASLMSFVSHALKINYHEG